MVLHVDENLLVEADTRMYVSLCKTTQCRNYISNVPPETYKPLSVFQCFPWYQRGYEARQNVHKLREQ